MAEAVKEISAAGIDMGIRVGTITLQEYAAVVNLVAEWSYRDTL